MNIYSETVDCIEDSTYPISREHLLKMLQNVHEQKYRESDPNNEAWNRLGDEGMAELRTGYDNITRWIRTDFGSQVLSFLVRDAHQNLSQQV